MVQGIFFDPGEGIKPEEDRDLMKSHGLDPVESPPMK